MTNTRDYLKPQEDGLSARQFGPWVSEKLDYLTRYIDFFETSMRGKWPSRNYIDLFAGSGKCICRRTGAIYLGSPLIALTTRYPFTGYFFVDCELTNITALKERCHASPVFDRIRFYQDDANSVVREIVDRIQRTPSLNLAFLDPDGLELEWNTVATLAELRRLDLIIHYPQMGLTRTAPKAYNTKDQNPVDRFFGGREWREIYERYCRHEEQFLHRSLMDHYKKKLESLDYTYVFHTDDEGAEPLIKSDQNAPLYRLLFASKHPLGHEFWEKVISRDVYGQRRLL